jgi:hypothetical protein
MQPKGRPKQVDPLYSLSWPDPVTSNQNTTTSTPDQGQNQTQHPDQVTGQEKATPQEPKADRERAQHQDQVRVGRENEKTKSVSHRRVLNRDRIVGGACAPPFFSASACSSLRPYQAQPTSALTLRCAAHRIRSDGTVTAFFVFSFTK